MSYSLCVARATSHQIQISTIGIHSQIVPADILENCSKTACLLCQPPWLSTKPNPFRLLKRSLLTQVANNRCNVSSPVAKQEDDDDKMARLLWFVKPKPVDCFEEQISAAVETTARKETTVFAVQHKWPMSEQVFGWLGRTFKRSIVGAGQGDMPHDAKWRHLLPVAWNEWSHEHMCTCGQLMRPWPGARGCSAARQRNYQNYVSARRSCNHMHAWYIICNYVIIW